MSFGGFGTGTGAFGTNNNTTNTTSTGFGGFGTNATPSTTTAFGTNNATTTGFGATNNTTGSSLFGAGNTTTAFGTSTPSAFGNTGTSAFGSKPAFGGTTTTGGGMFGSTTTPAATGFGTFGANNTTTNNATTSSPFGGGATSTMFGNTASKPAFGATTTGTTSLFGGGNTTTGTTGNSPFGGFGATANNPASTALGAVGDAPGTAAVTTFQPFVEKEGTSAMQNSYQTLLVQDPYKKWSADELRLADYVAGRRFGGPAGTTFGGTGFGNFGNTQTTTPAFGTANNTNLSGSTVFGSGTSTPAATGFGQTNANTTSAFGASSGNSIFGAKPAATGSLFGANTTTAQPAQTGSVFGNAGTGFGANNAATTGTNAFGTTNTNAGGGLFGNNNTQNKPSGFSFPTANNTTGGFGGGTNAFGTANNNATGGGGLFGNTANTTTTNTGGLFGNNNNQQATTGFGTASGFGAQAQQQQTGGLFGNQQKPAGGGLFGSTNNATTGTTGGLFGATNNNANNPFGQATNAQAGGTSVFGASKPATGTTGGLFGGGTTQNATNGGGLFAGLGNNQNQQQQPQQGGGLFGGLGTQNQQQQTGFGGATQQGGGGGLFGASTNPQGNSLFGGSTAQQPQNSILGNSLLGNSQGAQPNAPSLTASINDPLAYGSLFADISGSEVVNPGPLATPTNRKQTKRPSIVPYYKLNPTSASRFATPQKRGFGLSYSTYGTPSSPASVASTPGALSQSLLGGSLSRNLGKSVSTNNLRRSFNIEDSVLLPGAFSASTGPRPFNTGSMKKLVINKELRTDLFSTPTREKPQPESPNTARRSKRVSFDTTGNPPAIEDGSATNGAPNPAPSAEQLGYIRKSTNGANGSPATDADSSTPEMEQVKGNELAVVPEHKAASPSPRATVPADGEAGEYWMSPTKEEIENMNRVQRQKVTGLTVGRDNVGSVQFKVPVDLTSIDLDTICGGIVVLVPRSATVYPTHLKKPPVGKGLNVPSLISLLHAWPRASRTGKLTSVEKHVERLKKIPDTQFENYIPETGEWSFSVEHFTTYGLDDSEDEDEEAAPEPAEVARPRDSPNRTPNRASIPGAFDPDENYGGELEEDEQMAEVSGPRSSFLANRSVGSESHALVPPGEEAMDDEYAMSEVNDDTSAHPEHHLATERDDHSVDDNRSDLTLETPAGIMRARMRAIKISATPQKVQVAAGDDWMGMLSKSISPQKRDRALLKSLHEAAVYGSGKDSVREASPTKKRIVPDSRGFATSIDLMNSLFEHAKAPTENLQASVRPQGVKWPYKRVSKHLDESQMDEKDRAWHDTMRPTWGPGGTLIFSATPSPAAFGQSGRVTGKNGLMTMMKGGIVSETQDVRIAKFSNEMSAAALETHIKLTQVHVADGIPSVELKPISSIKDFYAASGTKNAADEHERLVWELAGVLFDKVKIPTELLGEPDAVEKLRRENLSRLWESMVAERTNKAVTMAHAHEEKALAALSGHRVVEACKHLIEGKDFRLATLVSLIGTSDATKRDMREQLKEWRDANALSEFSPSIRALYEMLSGNVCTCEGIKGSPENRAESFSISKKFGLNWQQAFGMRLWYAISAKASIAEAVNKYQEDVSQDRELPPVVWFVQHGIPAIWDDPYQETREDLLWGLLKLYTDDRADLEAILRPENSQLSPLDYRLCWQLGQALTSAGGVSFGKDAAEKADAATISFAAQLTNEGSWLEAVFVLLHLSGPDARAKAIQDHLCQHAFLIGNEDSTAFKKLARDFQIPTQWIWHAKALYMRSGKKDTTAEVQCLLRAESWAEAHQAFIKEVAPKTIIEQDYDGLADILRQFEGRHSHVPSWNVGGEVYKAFLQLMGHHRRSEQPPQALVDNLLEGLPAMHGNTPEAGVVEYAALTEMAAEVAKGVSNMARAGQLKVERILRLPLTEDVLLKHTRDLSWSHYNAILAGR
ncbi:hypothetical protein F5Y17DRAFT_418922 [Xylariaceae sp. FL0594]|nr:hypothetical protein F5Y17DRAFT_418922 [Xylariaceae sp. FL0594]